MEIQFGGIGDILVEGGYSLLRRKKAGEEPV